MKRFLLWGLLFLPLASLADPAVRHPVYRGQFEGDGTGDTPFIAYGKINQDIQALYSGAASIVDPGSLRSQLKATLYVDNVAAMLALTGTDRTNTVGVLGRVTVGDGADGVFVWQATSTESTNRGTCFAVDASGNPGRWARMWNGNINARWFAAGNGTGNDTAGLNDAISLGEDMGGVTVDVPRGIWPIDDTLWVRNSTSIEGTGAPMIIDGHTLPGSWLKYIGSTPGKWMMIVSNAPDVNVVQNISLTKLGFYGVSQQANGLLLAPPAHPPAQHSFQLSHLFFYQNNKCLNFGEGPDISDNQSDFHVISNVSAAEYGETFVESWIRNMTCVTFQGCSATAASYTHGIAFNFIAGDIIEMVNCAAGYGQIFVRKQGVAGSLLQIGTQWEGSQAPFAERAFYLCDSPLGFGNSKPATFVNCTITDALRINQNDNIVVLQGNTMYGGVIITNGVEGVRIYDNGNQMATRDVDLPNPNFGSNLDGWTSAGWVQSNGAAQHTAGNANALQASTYATNAWQYTIYFQLSGGSAGTVTPIFGSQQGSTYGYQAPGIYSQTWTNVDATGPLNFGFAPSSDFNGSIDTITLRYTAPKLVDNGTVNLMLGPDYLQSDYGLIMIGGRKGFASPAPFESIYFDTDNRVLRIGRFGDPGQLLINTTVAHAGTIYAAGDNPTMTLHNPFGGAQITLATTGDRSYIASDFPVLFASQDDAHAGQATGFGPSTRFNPANGHWIFGYDGLAEPSQIVQIKSGAVIDQLAVQGNIVTAGQTISTNGFFFFAPNGTRYHLKVDNSGALSTVAE